MSLNTFEIEFKELSQDKFLRNDAKYYSFLDSSDWNLFNSKSNNLISLKYILSNDYNLFDYQEDEEYKGIPTGQTYLDEDGIIIEYQPVTFDNHPGRLKYKVTNENILISSLRLAKSPALFFENQDLSEYVFSNGFYIFRTNKGWRNKFIVYLLRTKKIKNILDYHIYRGIGISAYKKEDLLKIKIPKITKSIQDDIINKIEPIEKKIKNLKTQINQPQEIINRVFAREFNFNIKKVKEAEEKKYFIISNDISFKNINLRTSVRWHKIAPIQKILYRNNPHIKKLGKYLVSTKNGWSPVCKETDSLFHVFSVHSISKDSYIKYVDLKASNQQKNNIHEFIAKNGDLFVSRGNTVDLVALASVVKDLPEDKEIIFPDLFIKLELDNRYLLKEYLAHLFNSIIGRFYFKYSSKGKNQTMVKISSEELNNFYIPIPPLKTQQKIIDDIKTKLEEQKKIKQKIEKERAKIDDIIEKAIK